MSLISQAKNSDNPFNRRVKNNKKPIIRQVLDLIPNYIIDSAIKKQDSDKFCSKYKTRDQLIANLFGQLCKCSTLEDISVGIGVSEVFISDLGLNPDCAIGFVMKMLKANTVWLRTRFYNEEIVHPILKKKIEQRLNVEAFHICNRNLLSNLGLSVLTTNPN